MYFILKEGIVLEETLPILIGFIMGEDVIPKINSHRHTAELYLKEKGLYDSFLKSNMSAEDDYLVRVLGAIKLYAYGGTMYLYCNHSIYRKYYRLIKAYKEAGYKMVIVNFESCIAKVDERRKVGGGYNLQIIRGTDGKYNYNPLRNGD